MEMRTARARTAYTVRTRVGLNEEAVKALPIPECGNRITYYSGCVLQGIAAPPGFGVRVTAAGIRSFILSYRHKGKEHRITIGRYPTWSALTAVKEARLLRQRIDRGEDPLTERRAPEPVVKTVDKVLDDFLVGHVAGKRSAVATRQMLNRLVRPEIGKLDIYTVRRSHLMRMLDDIARDSGPWMADRILSVLRSAFNWYAIRDDDFTSPIIRGMTRVKNRSRDRMLSDDEIRRIWRAAEGQVVFGALVRFLLLTATRRNEAARMSRTELVTPDTWLIPARRYKTGVEMLVPLSAAAQAVLARMPGQLPFAGRYEDKPFRGFGRSKTALDKASGVTGWRLHDLRRTARSLMSRAGIAPHIAEQALGHKIKGVAGVYDRHSYEGEKRRAFHALAMLVAQIVGDCYG
jgi:integrase